MNARNPLWAETAIVHPNVTVADDVIIHDWAVVGLQPPGCRENQLETVIESGAVIRSHSVIYAGSRIGPKFQTGHRALVGPGTDIGEGCAVGTNSVAMGFNRLRDGAKVHGLGCLGPFADIQEGAWIGPYCCVDSSHDNVTVVASQVILGLRVHVRAGVRVGERCLVGSRSLIHKDIPPYQLALGNPARSVQSIHRIVSPHEGVDRPYQPDPPELQEKVRARHLSREGDDIHPTTWRHDLWRSLGSPTRTI